MDKVTPFLWYDGQAEEAAALYVSLFKNSKIVSVTRYGNAGPGPKGTAMTVVFELDGFERARPERRDQALRPGDARRRGVSRG